MNKDKRLDLSIPNALLLKAQKITWWTPQGDNLVHVLVDPKGLEPLASSLQMTRSSQLS